MSDTTKSTQPETPSRIPRPVLRRLLEAHGGKFHGPRVEHVHMEEQAFWRFMDEVIDLAWRRQHLELVKR